MAIGFIHLSIIPGVFSLPQESNPNDLPRLHGSFTVECLLRSTHIGSQERTRLPPKFPIPQSPASPIILAQGQHLHGELN